MEKYFFMQPRRSGKTSKVLHEYMKKPDNTLIIVADESSREYVISKGVSEVAVITCNDLEKQGASAFANFTRIILDEYMFFPNRENVYWLINKGPDWLRELLIFSTSDSTYNNLEVRLVRNLKNKYCKNPIFDYKIKNWSLFSNFLTDSDIKIIDSVDPSYIMKVTDEGLNKIMSPADYNVSILNKYINV